MNKNAIYLEGGATGQDSKEVTIRCQQAFSKLLDKMGFEGRQPKLVACGGREKVFTRYCTEHSGASGQYIAMWIDSEEPIKNDIEKTWEYIGQLKDIKNFSKPEGANDDQVLFMTTCMETWIIADIETLKDYYGDKLNTNPLNPKSKTLESMVRGQALEAIQKATLNCNNPFKKGIESYKIIGELNPSSLAIRLPSFARVQRILDERL